MVELIVTDESQDRRYEEFLQHFLRDQARIFAYVRALLPHYADAQDVFQRCSLTLWRNFDQFDHERLFLPWACRIAFNEVRNFRRVAGRDKLQFADDLVEQLAEQRMERLTQRDQRSSALRTCVEKLKAADRDLLRLVYEESQTVETIAQSAGKAMQTIYNRLSALRRMLLDCIEQKLTSGETVR